MTLQSWDADLDEGRSELALAARELITLTFWLASVLGLLVVGYALFG